MLACEIASVACERLAQRARVELEPDEEHEQDDADLREEPEVAAAVAGSRNAYALGASRAEQRRAEQDAGDDLADDGRLTEPTFEHGAQVRGPGA